MVKFLLFLVASFLKWALAPILYIYGFIRSFTKNEFLKYHWDLALAKDQYGNGLGKYVFNDLFVKKGGYLYGNIDETISSATGKNKQGKTLTRAGLVFDMALELMEKGHSIKAIDKTIKGFIIGLLTALLIASIMGCGPKARLNRLLKNHPELIKKDTVLVTDTVKIPALAFDTAMSKDLFLKNIFYDTVTITKDRVITKIYTHRDTVRVKTIVRGQTIIKAVKVPINRFIYSKPGINWLWLVLAFAAGVVSFAFLTILVLRGKT